MTATAAQRVLYVTRSLARGGAERQLVAQAIGLHGRGYVVDVAVFYAGGSMEAELNEAGVPVVSLGKRSRWDLISPARHLIRHIRETRPDTVYSFMEGANTLAAMIRDIAPPFRLVWGIRTAELRAGARANGIPLLFSVTRLLARRADLIVSNSHAGAIAHATKGYPSKRMRVVPNGIDTERFAPDREGGRAMRSAWRILAGEFVVGLAGRLSHVKGHPNFFRAAARLRSEGMHLRLVCAGAGSPDYLTEMKTLVKALGLTDVVEWIENPPSMAAFYSALDVLCVSSLGEGFPNVIAEAMACEVPCVGTDVGDVRLILEGHGIVVAPGDVTALADGIHQALTDSTAESRARNRASIIHRFGMDAMLEKTAECLWGALDGS